MRGRILGVDETRSEGQISGDDGNRYSFSLSEWKSSNNAAPGQIVDFIADDGAASQVFRVGISNSIPGEKNRIVTALMALFLGPFGIHKFYLVD